MVELRRKKYLKRLKSRSGLVYYSFKGNHQRKSVGLDVVLKEISSPVVIKKKKVTTSTKSKERISTEAQA